MIVQKKEVYSNLCVLDHSLLIKLANSLYFEANRAGLTILIEKQFNVLFTFELRSRSYVEVMFFFICNALFSPGKF